MTHSINTYNVKKRGILNLVLSSPFIYSMMVPIALLHLSVQLYQQITFPLYGLDTIDSDQYIKDVRRYLPYLSWFEKINCLYCSYGNGVLAFAQAVAKQTEKMWCPIKNAESRMGFDLSHREKFAQYGDAQDLQKFLETSEHVRDHNEEKKSFPDKEPSI